MRTLTLRCQRVLEQIREAKVIQAARLRPVFHYRDLALLNNLVVAVTYDAIRTDHLRRGCFW